MVKMKMFPFAKLFIEIIDNSQTKRVRGLKFLPDLDLRLWTKISLFTKGNILRCSLLQNDGRAIISIFYYPQSHLVQTLTLWRNHCEEISDQITVTKPLVLGQFVRGQFVAVSWPGSNVDGFWVNPAKGGFYRSRVIALQKYAYQLPACILRFFFFCIYIEKDIMRISV